MRTSETEPASAQLRVVLIDSREERRKLMTDVVQGDGDRAAVVAEADTADSAWLAVRQESADAAVVELRMPTAVGLRTVQDLRRAYPHLGIVVCSFDLSAETIRQALLAGADTCLRKPASPHELVNALDAARGRSPDDDVTEEMAEPVATR